MSKMSIDENTSETYRKGEIGILNRTSGAEAMAPVTNLAPSYCSGRKSKLRIRPPPLEEH